MRLSLPQIPSRTTECIKKHYSTLHLRYVERTSPLDERKYLIRHCTKFCEYVKKWTAISGVLGTIYLYFSVAAFPVKVICDQKTWAVSCPKTTFFRLQIGLQRGSLIVQCYDTTGFSWFLLQFLISFYVPFFFSASLYLYILFFLLFVFADFFSISAFNFLNLFLSFISYLLQYCSFFPIPALVFEGHLWPSMEEWWLRVRHFK